MSTAKTTMLPAYTPSNTKGLQNDARLDDGLYWVASSASGLLPAVAEFLTRARDAGVDVAVVECATFDELAADIIKIADLPSPLYDWVMAGRPVPRLVPVQLPAVDARMFPVLRYSALLVEEMPETARRITLATAATSPEVRALLKERKCPAAVAAIGRELAVFGNDRQILEALAPLGPKLAGEIGLDPLGDSWALGLIYDALVRALARNRPLIPRYKRAGHSLVVARPRDGDDPERVRRNEQTLRRLRDAYGSSLTGKVPKLGYPYQEGLFLKLEHLDGRWWCGFEPYTFVHVPRPDPARNASPGDSAPADPMGKAGERSGDPAGDWRRERWAPRFNKSWAGIIDAWAQLLTSGRGPARAFGLNEGTGIDAGFSVSPYTGWSRPGHHHAYFNRSR